MMDTYPSADLVARIIIAAAKETGADPEAIICGEMCRGGSKGNFEVSRARAYAAFALKAIHQGCGSQAIARMVGVTAKASIGTYMASFEFQRRRGNAKWWSEETLLRVIAAAKKTNAERLRQADYAPLNTRKRPAERFEVVTSEFMGDPPPGRSALDKRGSET